MAETFSFEEALGDTPKSGAQPSAPAAKRSIVDDIGRQIGLTVRAGVNGLAAIPAMAADAVAAPVNFALEKYDEKRDATPVEQFLGTKEKSYRIKPAGQVVDNVMTAAGVPVPESSTERVVQDVASSMAGAGGIAKAGLAMAEHAASPVAKAVGTMLADGSAANGTGLVSRFVSNQGVSAATGGAASGITRESGGGEGAQLVAGLAGSVLPSGLAYAGRKPNGSKQLGKAAEKANAAGYVIPPADLNPGALTELVSGASGKIKTAQTASQRNQKVTNDLARKALGMADDAELTVDSLTAIRRKAGEAYKAVADTGIITPSATYETALDNAIKPFLSQAKSFPGRKMPALVENIQSLKTGSFDAGDAIETIKVLRNEADTAFRSGDKIGTKALKDAASALEQAIDDHLVSTGAGTDILSRYRDARTTIAKTYTIEKALNAETGNVSAPKIAADLAKGKPLTGELRTIGQVGQAFPKATQALKEAPKQVSPIDVLVGVGMAGTTFNPTMLGAVAARPVARHALLTKVAQKIAVKNAGVVNDGIAKGIPAVAVEALARGKNTQPAAAEPKPTVFSFEEALGQGGQTPANPDAPRIDLRGMAEPDTPETQVPGDATTDGNSAEAQPTASAESAYEQTGAIPLRPDGTLPLQGDPRALRETLVAAGIPANSIMQSQDGVLIGRSQVDQVQQVVKSMMEQKAAEELSSNPAVAQAETAQAATETIANEQGQTQDPAVETEAAPDQTALAMGGDATQATDVPGAGDTALPDPGVEQPQLASIDQTAHAAATSPQNDRPEPTLAQQRAGNYAMGHDRIAGMDVSIENPQGSVRRGIDPDGKPWETEMMDHYGYVKKTTAADGDKLDVFIKPGTPKDYAGPVYVVDQVDPRTGRLDEHKAVLGAADEGEAKEIYRRNYAADWQGMGSITRLPLSAFKAWAAHGNKKEPLGDLLANQEVTPATSEINAPEAQTNSAQPAMENVAPPIDRLAMAQAKIQRLRDAGEDGVADLMQQDFEKSQRVAAVPGELAAMREVWPDLAHHAVPEFAQSYELLRREGVKPAEAAGRAGILAAVTARASEIGMPEKALEALSEKIKTVPLDDAPNLVQRFTAGLISRGVMNSFEGAKNVGEILALDRDNAMHAMADAAYRV